MTTDEKKLLQAKHRLEEAEMRDRQKERKARTRRLIQEGAILEKVFPSVACTDLENAALRGVDVRIIVPHGFLQRYADQHLCYQLSRSDGAE